MYSADMESMAGTDLPPDERHLGTLATALARASTRKDSYTRSHCETVAELCVLIASELGLDTERVARIRIAGLLHDVGKIGISDAILQKPAALTAEEAADHARRTRISARTSSRRPSCTRRPGGSSTTTSASTAAATPTASRAATSRSSRASSWWRTPSRR